MLIWEKVTVEQRKESDLCVLHGSILKKKLNTGKMENKSEYGIYEEFLKNFDSVNYKNKDSSIINNEFQKVISELCEKI